MIDYELVDETNGLRYNHSWWRIAALILLYTLTTTLVFLCWNSAYDYALVYPPFYAIVPDWWYRRAHIYASSVHDPAKISHDFRILQKSGQTKLPTLVPPIEDVTGDVSNVIPLNGSIDKIPNVHAQEVKKIVCYYMTPNTEHGKNYGELALADVPPDLCTHVNIGPATLHNNTIVLSDGLLMSLNQVSLLRAANPQLKLLIWVGGGGTSYCFPELVRNHSNRKVFIQSLKQLLLTHNLDGIDLDWEFPSAYNKERQHFSQLLYEIRQEYIREKRDYLLTIAVAAPEVIALFAYDVKEINRYADYVNLMTYDYHLWSHETPYTGLNAPLYRRHNEDFLFASLNINYSVHWWLASGLDHRKLMVGLPTYGHSFTLVNPFNNGLGSPAENVGRCGSKGFAMYSEICWFISHNVFVSSMFDQQTCSPYVYSATEWISFENEMSIECKTRYVRSNDLGGIMIFSLNADDYRAYCLSKVTRNKSANLTFPLVETARRILYENCSHS